VLFSSLVLFLCFLCACFVPCVPCDFVQSVFMRWAAVGADAADHSGAWLLLSPVWLQLRVRATLRSFLVHLFVPKIKLCERERELHQHFEGSNVQSVFVIPVFASVPQNLLFLVTACNLFQYIHRFCCFLTKQQLD
jgi:hypothetical protein